MVRKFRKAKHSHMTLDFEIDPEAPLRMFEITEIQVGKGLTVRELVECGGYGKAFFIEDATASHVFEVGNSFCVQARDDQPIRVPPLWDDCPLCRANH